LGPDKATPTARKEECGKHGVYRAEGGETLGQQFAKECRQAQEGGIKLGIKGLIVKRSKHLHGWIEWQLSLRSTWERPSQILERRLHWILLIFSLGQTGRVQIVENVTGTGVKDAATAKLGKRKTDDGAEVASIGQKGATGCGWVIVRTSKKFDYYSRQEKGVLFSLQKAFELWFFGGGEKFCIKSIDTGGEGDLCVKY